MLIAAAALLLAAQPARDTSLATLRRQIAAIAAESSGEVGVAAIHVETGDTVSMNGATGFQMQSVFKLPLGISVLRRVEAGTLRLNASIPVTAADLRAGRSPIADEHPAGGVGMSIQTLLRLAVSESDNTAADLLLRQVGGPAAVTADLRRLGIRGVRVDRGEGELAMDFFGIPRAPGNGTRARIEALSHDLPLGTRARAFDAYLRDPRDTATPMEMARLLSLLSRGRALGPAGTGMMLRMMTETPTGPRRIKALLPAGTVVAHKTGLSANFRSTVGVANDVGLVTLPDGTHLAIAVFVRRATRDIGPAERAIARISRALYDHWSRRGSGPPPRPSPQSAGRG